MGPVEVLVIGFPGNKFNGGILPELQALTAAGTISIIDAVLVRKDGDSTVTFTEIEQADPDHDIAVLAGLMDELEDVITADDVEALAAGLGPDSSAAMLVFEHKWALGLRDAIVGSGGELVANFRVPKDVIDEVLAANA